jgi:non-specific protein-tyrosine kinase
MEGVITQLEMQTTPEILAKKINVTPVKDTSLIQLTVQDTDPTQAALIANTIAKTFIAQNEELEKERYSDSLATMQPRMSELSTLMEEAQAKIYALGTPTTTQGLAQLAHLETTLTGYRSTYTTLQDKYEVVRLTAAQAGHNVSVVEAAQMPESPVQRRTLYTSLAAVVSLMLGVGAAFLLEYLDDTIQSPEDVRQALGLDTLGVIGRLAKAKDELVVTAQPHSSVAEDFRGLCTNIRFSSLDKPLKTLLVTSPDVAEGKSFIVANLAAAMAQADLRVVAVDADMRRPRLHQLFGLDPNGHGADKSIWWGLSGALLKGNINVNLCPGPTEGLRVLLSGELPPNPAEMAGSEHMRRLLHALSQQADGVLLDSPPLLPVADSMALAQAVDGVLLVVVAGRTQRQTAQQAVEGLRQVEANLVGVVLNAVPTRKGSYDRYEEYYRDRDRKRKHRTRWQNGYQTTVQRLFGRKHRAK